MRSPPVVPYIYALESAIDELAVKLKMDPVELRRINDAHKDATGKEWSSRSLMKCYDQAAEAFGWSKRSAEPGSMRDGDWLIGWGCASAFYPTHIGASTARVKLNAERPGQCRRSRPMKSAPARMTVIAQMAAERLGIPLAQVRVDSATAGSRPSPVAGGSNKTASCCSAVMKACDVITGKLKAAGQSETVGAGAGGDLAAKVCQARSIDARRIRRVHSGRRQAERRDGLFSDPIKKLYDGTPTLVGGSHGKETDVRDGRGIR